MVKTDRGWTAGKNISLVKLNINLPPLVKLFVLVELNPPSATCTIAAKLSVKRVFVNCRQVDPQHSRKMDRRKQDPKTSHTIF